MTPELARIVADEIRHFLRRQGPRPRMLEHARLDYNVSGDRSELTLILVDGTDWHVRLGHFARYGAGDRRQFSIDCVRLYSQLYEDHLLELQLRASRENLDRFLAIAPNPDEAWAACRQHEQLERHLRRNHGVRRDNPMMVSPISNQTETEPPGTLTMETIRRAMRQLRMPTDRELRYDFRPGGITWADQVGDFGVAYGGPFATSEVGGPQAQARALALLKANLSPQQLAQYEREQYFEVIGGDSGKRYRIRHGRQMNIDELDGNGERVCGWCFLPQGGLAAGDVMLGQKIALECDESKALEVANQFGGGVPLPPSYLRDRVVGTWPTA
jgi:hypothetical protein